MTHEDERRILEDWPEGKLIKAKQDCIIGNHYHNIKTEKFILVSGVVKYNIGDGQGENELEWGEILTIYPGTPHIFKMKKGATMIGLCSHPYDPTDDYKI